MHGNGRDRRALPPVPSGIPILGANFALPEIIRALKVKPGERVIATLPGNTPPEKVVALARTLAGEGLDRPIIVADWVGLSCVEPDVAQLVERILSLRAMVQSMRDDTLKTLESLQDGPGAVAIAALLTSTIERLVAILATDAANPV